MTSLTACVVVDRCVCNLLRKKCPEGFSVDTMHTHTHTPVDHSTDCSDERSLVPRAVVVALLTVVVVVANDRFYGYSDRLSFRSCVKTVSAVSLMIVCVLCFESSQIF